MKIVTYRFATVIGLVVAAAALPPPLTLAFAVAALFFFRRLWEVVAIGVFVDALYAAPEPRWFGFQCLYAGIALLVFFAVEKVKKSIRFY